MPRSTYSGNRLGNVCHFCGVSNGDSLAHVSGATCLLENLALSHLSEVLDLGEDTLDVGCDLGFCSYMAEAARLSQVATHVLVL